jgi:hypothetical protein
MKLAVAAIRRTHQISDPAALILDCQPERPRRVRGIWFVRQCRHVSHVRKPPNNVATPTPMPANPKNQ